MHLPWQHNKCHSREQNHPGGKCSKVLTLAQPTVTYLKNDLTPGNGFQGNIMEMEMQ